MRPMEQKTKSRARLLVLCYLAAMLAWLCVGGIRLALNTVHLNNGQLPRLELGLEDFEAVGLIDGAERGLPGTIISTDADAQLIYEQAAGFYVTQVVLDAAPLNRGAGETVLYYTTRPGQGFSEAHKVWAAQDAAGRWVFDLGGRRIFRLRLDPDTVGGVVWRFGGVVLNERVAPVAIFLPGVRQAALLALAPLVAFAALCEVLVFVQPLLARRRFEKKWGLHKGSEGAL